MQDQPAVPYPSKSALHQEERPPTKSTGNVSLEIEIVENDLRARQFASHLRLENETDSAVNLLAINYRLGSGVTMEKTENTSLIDLKLEYDQLRTEIGYLFRTLYITGSEAFRKEFAKNYMESLRAQFRLKSLVMIYYYVITGRFRLFARQQSQAIQRMDFPITSADVARASLSKLDSALQQNFPVMKELATAKIDRMAAIEQIDPNFLKPQYVTQILPGETFEQVFIFKARRKLSSIVSYTAAFEVKLSTAASSGRTVERILSRSASFNVTPSPIALSAFAAVFGLLGTILNNFGLPDSATLSDVSSLSQSLSDTPLSPRFLKNSVVAVILSVVLYNSFEMTEFKDRFKTISWRSAMFIGLLCGLLSDRMLKAITSFVG
ncbi:hypothetical protein [Bradyrhizobium sp.]|uniref:hypothetical protein n=1 Tax=Bradyrhizobium sp. TaxID=376 RepID=UPI001ED0B7E5|nr:hypothetical protein [Bradyrhizobium sp.]MBV8920021.1 hypothetical protein [Bradyrhizobium sp.]MBV9984098.1 hypothetical protein [Bradyrhizobium sp.]